MSMKTLIKCRPIKKYVQRVYSAISLASLFSIVSSEALAVNIDVSGGWVCNMWMQQPGVLGAASNNADFNVKATPTSSTMSGGFIAGEVSDYLSSLGKNFNSLIDNLPLMEPLNFNLASENFGARFGVDVCLPALVPTRDDVLEWTVTVSGLGPLIPLAQGDWFSVTTPKVEMQLLASNCNSAVGTPMSTSAPSKTGSCEITNVPAVGADRLNFVGQPLVFKFIKMVSREMVMRISISEQTTGTRPHRLDAGIVNFDFVDPPLPPLLIGDLLGKQLFSAPETNYVDWPGCVDFDASTGIAFSSMNLQGPNSSLDLRWTGRDRDCPSNGGCPDGNVGGNNFDFPVAVYLEDGTLAGPNTSPTAKVRNFLGLFNDQSFSGESFYPANGNIEFNTEIDKVYRDEGKAFFSTTVSRQTGPSTWRSCRVWFKRDNGFDCSTLPTPELQNLCHLM